MNTIKNTNFKDLEYLPAEEGVMLKDTRSPTIMMTTPPALDNFPRLPEITSVEPLK